nr:GGDEF domain-containing protein [Oricola nitratireducens]
MEIVTRLTRTSETDPLTGVLNRRGFDSRIAALYEGPSVEGHCHAVVMADIDHFKSVNDRHGHDAGDAILSRFARILQGAARDSDFVVRWGGEEFMIVITNSDVAGGRLYAETVRAVFESQRHERLGGDSVTASFGIAEWRQGQKISEVGRLADLALYRAKREGRNRVCIHRSGVHEHGDEWAVA